MLDRLNIWNYVAKATLTITFGTGSHEPQYFWVLDEGNFVASHAIVVALPFGVVDVTVKHQPYPPNVAALVPDVVVADQSTGRPGLPMISRIRIVKWQCARWELGSKIT